MVPQVITHGELNGKMDQINKIRCVGSVAAKYALFVAIFLEQNNEKYNAAPCGIGPEKTHEMPLERCVQ